MGYSHNGRCHRILNAISFKKLSFAEAVHLILPESKGKKAAVIFVQMMLKNRLLCRGYLGKLDLTSQGWDALELLDTGANYNPERKTHGR